jgi:ligand-binding sensor domain-containing protein
MTGKCFASFPFNETIKKITSMAEDGDGIMWLGTNDGVYSAEVENGTIKLKNANEQKNGIPKNEVLAVYVNRYNQLYISYADRIIQTDGLREEIYDIKILQKDMIGGHATCIIDDKSGNTYYAEFNCKFRVVININLEEFHIRIFIGNCFDSRRKHLTRTTPVCIKIK